MHDVTRGELIEGALIPHYHEGESESRLEEVIERWGEFFNPALSVILIIASWFSGSDKTPIGMNLSLIAVVLSGYPIVKNAIVSTIENRRLNAEVLVASALVASIWVGEYLAGAIVVLMMSIGELLEDITIAKTGQAIRKLMELSPDVATVIRDRREVVVDISEVRVGDLVVVKAGEKIPVDGKIDVGEGEVDQAPITGESMPVSKGMGDDVYGGTINKAGVLIIRTTKIGKDTTLAKIIDLVKKAQAAKPPIERIADRFSSFFTPSMLLLSLMVYLLTGEILRAVTVLVVACPCALVIATPTAVVAGIGNAARRGILIKGGATLEIMGKLSSFVFDKTGTLTYGSPEVKNILGFNNTSEAEVIEIAATAERYSEHSLGKAILAKAGQMSLSIPTPEQTKAIAGKGIEAISFGEKILAGNLKLYQEKGIEVPPAAMDFLNKELDEGKTSILVARNGAIIGGISIADKIKEEVFQAIKEIRGLGIGKVVLLTGDNRKVAETAVRQVGFDEIVADLLPEGKVEYIQKLKDRGEKVAMVGDGINDAPALALADVGIAMGAMGTDVAIEAADIALVSDEISKVVEGIALSRKTIWIIKQSLAISIFINGIALLLASFGTIGPVMGAVVHNIGSLVVVGNSSRLIGYKYKK